METGGEEVKYLTPEQAALNSVPDFLRKSSSKKNEEMLSNQVKKFNEAKWKNRINECWRIISEKYKFFTYNHYFF